MSGKSLEDVTKRKLKTCKICNNKDVTVKGISVEGIYSGPACHKCTLELQRKVYNDTNKDQWVECVCCGWRAKEIIVHIRYNHKDYPKDQPVKSQEICNRMKGDKNPAYGHGGRLSPFSKNFKNGYDEEWNKQQKERQSAWSKENSIFSRNSYSSDEEHSKAQTRDLEYFISKYGEIEGRAKHKAKTEKWLKNFKKNNFSRASQVLFNSIMKSYVGNVYYATYDSKEKTEYINKEYRLELDTTFCLPDFIDVDKKKIIEFDGTYWHGDVGRGNKERDNIRDEKIKKAGYEILHICEMEYKKFPNETVQKCLNFLTQ